MSFDVEAIRQQFPILQQAVNGKPLVYLDNAATTQKPQCVIDSLVEYYQGYNSNVHRGAHHLADVATQRFEKARETVANFIGANESAELIWTAGTTEAINLVANGLGQLLEAGDEIIVSEMEHHANLVPWQQVCKKTGAILKIAPINNDGELDIATFDALLSPRTKMLAIAHVSNALGTINPVKALTAKAKAVGAWVFVDGAQGVAHGGVDVKDIGCDFYAFSAHKLFGPTGMGALWGKRECLELWPVYRTGGEMISEVTYQSASWNVLPYKFEAGTPNIAGAIGMAKAVEWFQTLDLSEVKKHEQQLISYAIELAMGFEGLSILGNAANKIGVLSFNLQEGHSADVGFLLNQQGIAIRTGHHCAEPLMQRLGVSGTARASFSIYNTLEEVDTFFKGLKKAQQLLA